MWESVKLKDIALIKGGKRIPKGKKLTDAETPFPYLRVSDFGDNGTIDISNLKYVPESVDPEIKNYTIHSDDVYISIAGTIGKVGIVPDMLDGANLTENAAKLVLGDNCFNKYIALVLSSQHVTEQIKESTRTAAQPKLSLQRMGEISIPLPPLAEQQRIVAKLDAAFAEIDGAIEAAKKSELEMKTLQKLMILEKIQSLPSSCHQNFGNVCSFVRGPFGGSLKKSIFVESGIAVYEQQHPINDQFDSFRYFISLDKFDEMKRFEVNTGDVLMSCSGVTLGKTGIVPDYAPQGIINQALLKITPNQILDSEYLQLVMRSEFFQKLIWDVSGGAAQPNVPPIKVIKELRLPVPSIQIQHEIIAWKQTLESNLVSTIKKKKSIEFVTLKSAILAQELQSEAA